MFLNIEFTISLSLKVETNIKSTQEGHTLDLVCGKAKTTLQCIEEIFIVKNQGRGINKKKSLNFIYL